MPIKVRHNGLEIDGNLVPLVSGTIHYWRHEPALWPKLLQAARDMGFSMVETYVPWAVHETAPGEFDMGQKDPAKNLDHFLSQVTEAGLKIIVRPGPHINAELTNYGFPEWVVRNESLWARDAHGAPAMALPLPAPFPIVSYANQALFDAYEPYFNALAPVLQKHLHPHGPIVAMQVDNEMAYFFRTGTYDLDYCDASIALFCRFLELKYRQLKALNQAWGSSYKSFGEAQAPRQADTRSLKAFAACRDWAEYKEYQIQWALSRLTEMFRQKGFDGLPLFHNLYSPTDTPFNLPDLEKDTGLDFCGIDAYPHAHNGHTVLDKARYMVLCGRLPYFPEYGAGTWPTFPVRTVEDDLATLLLPFMGGARGVNFYMLAERERWLGSPIQPDGACREEQAQAMKRLNHFLKSQEWHLSHPQLQAALIHTREAQIEEAAMQMPAMRLGNFARLSVPESLQAEPQAAGFFKGEGAEEKVGPQEIRRYMDDARAFLRQQQLVFGPADSGIATDKLGKLGLVVLTCWGSLDESFARKILNWAEEGGQLILGPCRPRLNARFEPLKAFEELKLQAGKPVAHGDGKILWCPGGFDSKAALAMVHKARLKPEISLSDASLDLAVHKLSGRQVIFIRNPHQEPRACTVFKEGKFVLKPLFSSGKFLGAVEEREVRLEARETRVWEVIPC
jgi:beta-galactosidase